MGSRLISGAARRRIFTLRLGVPNMGVRRRIWCAVEVKKNYIRINGHRCCLSLSFNMGLDFNVRIVKRSLAACL